MYVYTLQVGGDFFTVVVSNMNEFGRVSICGAISQYNTTGVPQCERLTMYTCSEMFSIPGPENQSRVLFINLENKGKFRKSACVSLGYNLYHQGISYTRFWFTWLWSLVLHIMLNE